MAIVHGALHSDTVRGSIASQLTYRRTNGQATCRKLGRSTQPLSEAQQLHHAAFSMLAASWRTASAEDRASWTPLALPYDASNYAPYLRFNFARIADGQSTTTIYPPDDGPTITARVENGTEAPTPDCTGDYITAGQLNGKPIYSQVPDGDYTISYVAAFNTWYLARVHPGTPPIFWNKPAGETAAGTYNHLYTATGHPAVTIL